MPTAPASVAPTTTTTTAPNAPVTTQEDHTPSGYMDNISSELDAMASDDGDKATPPPDTGKKPDADDAVTPPQDQKSKKPADDPDKGKTVEPPEAEPPAEPPKPVKAAELRAAYEKLKKEEKETYRPTIQRLEAKVKELESRKPEDPKPLLEKMSALEKRNAELEGHMRFVDFTQSTEFKDKYEKPFNDAWGRAVKDFEQLSVRLPDGTDETSGEPKFTTRKATPEDLLQLANMGLSEMDERATEMFGRSAPRVIAHVEKIKDLFDAKKEAIENASKEATTRTTEITQKTQAEHAARVKAFETHISTLATKFPDMFAEKEGDTDGNTLFQRGLAEVDRLFKPTAETRPNAEEAPQLHARIRMKAANHDRVVLWLRNAQKEIAELKKTVADYEKSEPPAGRAGNRGAQASATDYEAEIDALAR